MPEVGDKGKERENEKTSSLDRRIKMLTCDRQGTAAKIVGSWQLIASVR
jgi:hypothetical protein